MQHREKFLAACLAGHRPPLKQVCKEFGVSRKTAYKWLARVKRSEGLADRSTARKSQAHRTPDDVVALLVAAKKKYSSWGPKKLVPLLEAQHPSVRFPATSTAGEILDRAGLVSKRSRRPEAGGATVARSFRPVHAPNTTWYADHKGQFRLGNGIDCYPGTITDGYSRKLLRCTALPNTNSELMRRVFESAFIEYGLPDVVRTDNGNPFGSTVGGICMSALSVWLIERGVAPEFIQPGKPQQNGSHERMHRTLKAEAVRPVCDDLVAQQRRFDDFREKFNAVRPHEALGQRTPDALYSRSARSYEPGFVIEPNYPNHVEVRRVCASGTIKWRNSLFTISRSLRNRSVAFEYLCDGLVRVQFHSYVIGCIDEASALFIPNPEWHISPLL